MIPTVKKRIIDAVNHLFEQQVQHTAELVRIPSQRGQEARAQDWMAQHYRGCGLDVDQWKVNVQDIQHLRGFSPVNVSYDNAYNTVGSWRPSPHAVPTQGHSLIVNGHIDVVPTGPLGRWGLPPYDPVVRDGWLHGRGAGDMKAGLMAGIAAFNALRHAGLTPTATIHFQSVIEEECTGNGALACLQRGYQADAALIPEPMPQMLRGQTGTMWFDVEVQGDPAHASGGFGQGMNPIEKMYSLIQALKTLEQQWNACKGQHQWFAQHPHPIKLNIGRIQGGEWPSSVPSSCTLQARVGVYPGRDLATVREEIVQAIQQASLGDLYLQQHPPQVRFVDGFQAEGYLLEPGSQAEDLLTDCHTQVFGEALEKVVFSGTTDARFFGLYDHIPALVYGPQSRNIHSFNEAVNLDSLRQVTQTMALFMASWCGVVEK